MTSESARRATGLAGAAAWKAPPPRPLKKYVLALYPSAATTSATPSPSTSPAAMVSAWNPESTGADPVSVSVPSPALVKTSNDAPNALTARSVSPSPSISSGAMLVGVWLLPLYCAGAARVPSPMLIMT